MDLAAKHMDPEDLSIVVALSEGKAVALWCAIMTSHTEENLIDRVVGDLCTALWVQQPVSIGDETLLLIVVAAAEQKLAFLLCAVSM